MTAMPLFSWSPTYELGLPSIDRQHRALVDAINELHDAMVGGRDRDQVQRTIHALISYTKIHFESEEQFLIAKGYPRYSDHREEHHAFIKRVLDFHNQYMDGRVVLSAEIMQFLKDWLASHILVEDRSYAQWMRQCGVVE